MSCDLHVDFRSFSAQRPPALLLGGLDLLRPLGFAGIPVVVASPGPHERAWHSRYCRGRLVLPSFDDPAAVARCLTEAGARFMSALGCRIPLFYGNDDHLSLIGDYREALSPYFLFVLNDAEVGNALIDKDRFTSLARERGLPVPRTLDWDGEGDDALANAKGPVLAKPKTKTGWEASDVHLRLFGGEGKARVFGSAQELMANPLAVQLKDRLTIQEYIQGDDRNLWSFHGYADEHGTLLASFVGHKLRTYPPLTGLSTYVELAHNQEVTEIGRDVAARIPLKGVFKIDFKKDAATGRLAVLEVNARFNLWHHPAARNGVNLPAIAYEYLVHGTRPQQVPYDTTYRWLYFRLDYFTFRELAARGELTVRGWLRSLVSSRKVYCLFSYADPLPLLWTTALRIAHYARRGTSRIRSRLERWLSTAS